MICNPNPQPVRRTLFLAVGLLIPMLGKADEPNQGQLQPGPEIESDRLSGEELFKKVWLPGDPSSRGGDGLGPVFNAQSCLNCHDQGGVGGAGRLARNIEIATVSGGSFPQGQGFAYSFQMNFGNGRMEYRMASPTANQARQGQQAPQIDRVALAGIHPGFRDNSSVILHRFGIDPEYHTWRSGVPGRHGIASVQISERNPTPLFGVGLIDAIPDEVIEAAASRRFAGSSRVRGRVSRLPDGRIGRFGWKAQTATLKEFVRSAAASELGLEVPGFPQAADPRLPGLAATGLDLDEEDCEALLSFVRDLPRPIKIEPVDEEEAARILAGESTFRSIGCTGCHLPDLGDVEGIYSDLLLHEMSPRLADTGAYGVLVAQPRAAQPRVEAGELAQATEQEWRTPPLWGLRDSGPYLHDGRALTIEQAIFSHGGQGATAARLYSQLSPRRKQQLEAFLLSLSAPGP